MKKNITIIGGGWYGCYSAFLLQDIHNVTLIEKNEDIFTENSSRYNQNRLHLGYHYPRNYNTRKMCRENFNKFIELFKETDVISEVEKNYYGISDKSVMDYQTYKAIYMFENYNPTQLENIGFCNINNNILNVEEKFIDPLKVKQFFERKLTCRKIYNKKVEKCIFENRGSNVNILLDDGNVLYSDLVIDCTLNLLNLSSKKYIYEKNIILVFEKTKHVSFDALTIMDGDFCSLYPYNSEKTLYTLTDVEYTPLIKSYNYNEIIKYEFNKNILPDVISNMTNKIKNYYPEFEYHFKYSHFTLANKTKNISTSDARECNIENINDKIITINCGKICGIFEMETYYKEFNLI
jgi:hypothetical protein